ncbi:glycosyltransferase family 39 protein [uncultured Flavobacterium sp.]|uniref:ArnT family glycosyltransferase n=1 Tax=uncultured Flavobacterium sp. TaxID=165435 RepID=UPI00292D316D|nr:glycosyltransferase family 39 protein [uncultured Flavobacterium sp.]
MTKKTLILIGFIILKFVLQCILISPEYDLQRDEYLHLDQAHHLAWGYLSVPPVTSWFSYLIYLLGNSVFWIKFFPALFGALTLLIVWKTIETLKGNLYALTLGATCVLFSSLLRINTLYQPNSLDILCWTGFYYVIIQYFKTEKTKWLYIGAIVFAFGFLNKYNILFLLIGLLPALLLSKQRQVLAKKELYFALLLGLILILPNLLWQYNNQFPIVHHLKELADTQLVNTDRIGFLKEQLLFFIGAFFVILASLYALLFYKAFNKFKFFFAALFFTLLIFIYFKAKAYYAIGLYPIYIAFGAVFLSDILKTGWKRFLQPIFIIIPLLFFIPMYNLAFPNKSPEYIVKHPEKYKKLDMLRWEDGKDHALPQDFADMLGWKELARKTDSVYATLPNQDKTLVLCDNYGQAGAINYYTKKGIKAVSFNADYVNWFNLKIQYKNVIRIIEIEEAEPEFKETGQHFQTSAFAGQITNKYAREYKTSIFTFLGAKNDINKIVKQEIKEVTDYSK